MVTECLTYGQQKPTLISMGPFAQETSQARGSKSTAIRSQAYIIPALAFPGGSAS
jgi:hypothetical protein